MFRGEILSNKKKVYAKKPGGVTSRSDYPAFLLRNSFLYWLAAHGPIFMGRMYVLLSSKISATTVSASAFEMM
jgi:hypothetical protein